jgi:hypothetical protein
MDRHCEHVADAQSGVWFVGWLPVDANGAFGHQPGAVGACSHETCAPKPLVEPLPVAIFLLRYRRPLAFECRQCGERTMWPGIFDRCDCLAAAA